MSEGSEAKSWWVAVFGDCGEAALRYCAEAEALEPDDLGCPATRTIPRERVRVTARWRKNGVDRVEFEELSE